jgi:recombination protein RecR
MMEQAQCYQGLYFVLMGALSPLDGWVRRRSISIGWSNARLDGCVREAILATNFTVEGEATAHYVGSSCGRRASR